MNEVAKTGQAMPQVVADTPITPMDMLQIAVEKGADLEKLQQLMDLNDRWEANQAKRAFISAMTAFRAECPTIDRTRKAHNSKYAGLAEALEQIKELLSKNGLSHSWKTGQTDNSITVTCCVTHVQGHQECTSLSAGADTSGSKNSIQAIGSTISYLERYSLFAVLGLASKDQDDDGANMATISEEQKEQIIALIKETKSDTKKFLAFLGVETVDQIPASSFLQATRALEAKKVKSNDK